MKPRFQTDADLRFEIVSGVLRREPAVDFQSAQQRLPAGTSDPLVLLTAANEGRIVVSHDVRTMPRHFHRFLEQHRTSPGVFLIPQAVTTSDAIEELVMIWAVSSGQEWQSQLIWLPL